MLGAVQRLCRHWPLVLLPIFCLFAGRQPAHAVPVDCSALTEASARGPLDVAATVGRLGDEAVLECLVDPDPIRGLGAIRAARFLDAPETALPALSEIASGRHPFRAPAAVRSAWEIARRVVPRELGRREASVHGLAEAQRSFSRLSKDKSARADLRYVSGFMAERLRALLVAK